MKAAGVIEFEEGDCARISGALTFETTPALYNEMATQVRGNSSPAVLNLAGVTAVDSAGLALLLEWQAARNHTGSSIQIANAPSSLVRLAQLCEAVDLLNLSGRHE